VNAAEAVRSAVDDRMRRRFPILRIKGKAMQHPGNTGNAGSEGVAGMDGVSKPLNPKDALGILKVCWSVIPLAVLWEIGVGMLEGALKYGRHNYLVIGVRASVYFDATVARHMAAFWEGEDTDPESGVSHVTKAICSLIVLRAAMIFGTWIDDRPPKTPAGHLDAMNVKVKALLEKYPEPVAAYWADGKRGPGRIL